MNTGVCILFSFLACSGGFMKVLVRLWPQQGHPQSGYPGGSDALPRPGALVASWAKPHPEPCRDHPHPRRGKPSSLSLTLEHGLKKKKNLLLQGLWGDITHPLGFCYNKQVPGPNIIQCPQMPPRFQPLPCLVNRVNNKCLKSISQPYCKDSTTKQMRKPLFVSKVRHHCKDEPEPVNIVLVCFHVCHSPKTSSSAR